jgi:hypothetical protein
MDKEKFFFTLFLVWYFTQYGPPQNVLVLLIKLYNYGNNFFEYFNSILSPEYFKYNKEEDDEEEEDNIPSTIQQEEPKPQPRYEDKYLNEIRKLDKEIKFDEKEIQLEGEKFIEIYNDIRNNIFDKIQKIKDELGEIEVKLTKYEGSDDDYCICDDEEGDSDSYLGETKEERVKNLLYNQVNLLNKEKEFRLEFESDEGKQRDTQRATEMAREFVVKKNLERLKNCHVIEHTPLGNVLMIYDLERETFKFYSDNTIPYRYLEVVARKYVKQFGCRSIFVDMEEELKLAEEKCDKEKKEKEQKEEEEKIKKEAAVNKSVTEEKKNVFAKFKSYNKESGTGHVNSVAPPKNSIPNKKINEQQENDKVLLKDKANRYTYEGKFANFSFIKKIDRKVVDKKFGMTFADFKKKQVKNLF